MIWLLNFSCPSRCVYCNVEHMKSASVDAETAARIAREIVEAGFTEVTFVGGEPLISPVLPDALRELAGKVEVGLFTGGIPGDKRRLVERISHGVDRIVASVDAADEVLNDSLRGRSGITRDLYEFLDLVRERWTSDFIGFNSVVTTESVDGVSELWDKLVRYRPTVWALTLAGDNLGQSPSEHFLTRVQIRRFYGEIVPELAEATKRAGTELVVLPTPSGWIRKGLRPFEWRGAGVLEELEGESTFIGDCSRGDYNAGFVVRHGCVLPGMDITVGVNGEVWPCSQAPVLVPEHIVGRLSEQSLSSILAGDELSRFARTIPHAPCRRCWAPSNFPRDLLPSVDA